MAVALSGSTRLFSQAMLIWERPAFWMLHGGAWGEAG